MQLRTVGREAALWIRKTVTDFLRPPLSSLFLFAAPHSVRHSHSLPLLDSAAQRIPFPVSASPASRPRRITTTHPPRYSTTL